MNFNTGFNFPKDPKFSLKVFECSDFCSAPWTHDTFDGGPRKVAIPEETERHDVERILFFDIFRK